MYGRVANPRVGGGSTHLKNIPTSSLRCRDWWRETILLCYLGNEVCKVAIRFQCGVNIFLKSVLISLCFRIE